LGGRHHSGSAGANRAARSCDDRLEPPRCAASRIDLQFAMPERLARTTDPEPSHRRLRFEIIFASLWLAIGLFLLPALIFWVGIVVLGPYGEAPGAGLGTFYADFFGDLATGEIRTWFVALGPLILVLLARAAFIGAGARREKKDGDEPQARQAPPAKAVEHRRVEPRVGD
jgi:hypothetical protein